MSAVNIKELKTFEDRYNYDVSNFVEVKKVEGTSKKTGKQYSYSLNYLSWAYAQKLGRIIDPEFKWKTLKNENGSLNHDGFVVVEMTFLGETQIHNFPILDGANNAIARPNAFDINTAQMRGMAKLFAMMSGFGLSLYTGEDIRDLENTGTRKTQINKEEEQKRKEEGIKEILILLNDLSYEQTNKIDDIDFTSLENYSLQELRKIYSRIIKLKNESEEK